MMCSRSLAVVLMVLLGRTAEVGATLIMVYRTDAEVFIAADSLRTQVVIKTPEIRRDETCKVFAFGDAAHAVSGMTGQDGGIAHATAAALLWQTPDHVPIQTRLARFGRKMRENLYGLYDAARRSPTINLDPRVAWASAIEEI